MNSLKKFMLLLFLVTGLAARAQVVVTPQLPAAGLFMKNQLWNLAIVNSGYKPMTVQLQITITDQKTGQMVLAGNSRQFMLEMLPKQYTYNELGPAVYQDANPSYQVDNSPTGYLPIGNFTICYNLLAFGGEGVGSLAEECLTMEVQPISPPQLVMPADADKVTNARPSFSWTPPMPYQLFSALQYEISVAEVQSYQTPAEAIQNNVPVWRKAGLLQTQIEFPSIAPALDTSKLYAWRIQAQNSLSPVSASEVWTFRVQPVANASRSKQPGAYYELPDYQNSKMVRVEGTLRFVFDNRDNQAEARIRLVALGDKSSEIVSLSTDRLKLTGGKNFIDINLASIARLTDKSVYQFEVAAGSEKRYLTFQYFKP